MAAIWVRDDLRRQANSSGWMARQSLAGPFAEAAFKLQPSSCAKPIFTNPPVKTGHGFHVIMCVVGLTASSDEQG